MGPTLLLVYLRDVLNWIVLKEETTSQYNWSKKVRTASEKKIGLKKKNIHGRIGDMRTRNKFKDGGKKLIRIASGDEGGLLWRAILYTRLVNQYPVVDCFHLWRDSIVLLDEAYLLILIEISKTLTQSLATLVRLLIRETIPPNFGATKWTVTATSIIIFTLDSRTNRRG